MHTQPGPGPSSLPFSPSVSAEGLIYLSGVLALDEEGRVSGGIREQTRAVLEQIGKTLAAHGRSLHDALSVTVYLKSPEDFAAMNDVYKSFLGDAPAARTTVAATLMVPDALIEVSVVAAGPGTERRIVHPDRWLRSPNPYSYAVEARGTIFLSGLIARNPVDNAAVPGDMAAQTRTVLENARTLLEAAGLTLEQVVSARVYVSDLAEFESMNRVYRTYFAKNPPARATVGARLMSPSNVVEMTFVASRSPKEVIAGEGPANPNLSAAIRSGPRLYVSGMLGTGAGRSEAAAQTRETLRRIDAVLERAGFDWPDVVENLVYLSRPDDFAAMNGVYRGVLPTPYPARTTAQAALVAQDGLVEIMTTAVKR